MKKWISWIDVFFYGFLALATTGLSILAATTQQEWSAGKIIVLILTPLIFVGLALFVILSNYFSKPDFVTKHGTAIWSGGVPGLNQSVMEKVLDFFVRTLPTMFGQITEKQILTMLDGARIEWRNKPITLYSVGWRVKDKAGLQQGKGAVVQWLGSVVGSAFFHEMLHMVDEEVLHKEPDYEHENVGFWTLESSLATAFEKHFNLFFS